MVKPLKPIALCAPVTITAAEAEGADGKKSPPKFEVTAYTGGPMNIEGYDVPIVVDLAGMQFGNSLVANLDHDRTKRVGHVTEKNKADGQLKLGGLASAATSAREEVVNSAAEGFVWQASIEAQPTKLVELDAGKTATVNGQEITGPAYIARKSVLKGFAFVSHGADDNTSVTIAASAASKGRKTMKAEVAKWIKGIMPSVDTESLSDEEVANVEADYEGREGKRAKAKAISADPFDEMKSEAKRRADIQLTANRYLESKVGDLQAIEAIEKLVRHAIDSRMDAKEFRCEMAEASFPDAHTVFAPRDDDRGLSNRILQAALCETGRLNNLDKHFSDKELQTAHDAFPTGISLGQLFHVCAKANGYRDSMGGQVTLEVQRAAFRMNGPRQPMIRAAGFSTIDIANIVAATANKFMMDGWNAVDQTCLRIASIRTVKNFQAITTVSLTDSVRYEQIGGDGEIKHGTLDELTYTNQADTYAKMLAITRKDIINDDTGALTAVPRKLGNGAIKILNHIFWTEFLSGVSTNFFSSGNANINTGVADMTIGGLDATETIFMNQTNPDGTPLALQPAILLVPTALKNKALTLMGSMLNAAAITSLATATGDMNPFQGRFRVESSPYISNSTYTGNTSTAWWMMANPNDLAVIEIAALNGRVEPTVDTADADFNTLGVQMRGYCDVGVNFQEFRAGVHADGGAS